MFDHVTLRVTDRAASRRFYETALASLGHRITHSDEHFDEWNDFGIAEAGEGSPLTRRLHVAFVAQSQDEFVLDPDGNNVEAVNHNR